MKRDEGGEREVMREVVRGGVRWVERRGERGKEGERGRGRGGVGGGEEKVDVGKRGERGEERGWRGGGGVSGG